MRVLLVDGSAQDRDQASRYLESAGHQVTAAGDAKSAFVVIEREMPDIVVLEGQLQGMTTVQFLQRLRAREQSSRAYVVVVSAKPSIHELTTSIAAGADDYMRKPLQRDELVIRVGALDRIRSWASKVFPTESAGCVDLFEKTQLSRLRAWQSVDRSIKRDIGELIGQSLAPMSCENALASCVLGAQMPLTLASEQTEVRLTVGIERGAIPKLAALCLGEADASEEMVRDVLREFANTSGGAFVRAAAQEGVALTHGLPVDLKADAFTAPRSGARQQFVLATRDGSLQINFELEILSKALRRVHVGQLTEGMVLARDLHTESGAMLVPAGTRLTSTQIERLGRILSARVSFDVAEAA